MSWYRNNDGDIIVSADNEITPENNLQFQMGTMPLQDGSYLLLDESLLYLCGKKKNKRRFFGRRSSEEVTLDLVFTGAVEKIGEDEDSIHDSCPRKHEKCRFYNDVYCVCSIAGNYAAMKKEKTPCSTAIVKK